jgi:hypothetical protein
MPCGTTISSAREWDEMEPHAVPSHPIPLQAIKPLKALTNTPGGKARMAIEIAGLADIVRIHAA